MVQFAMFLFYFDSILFLKVHRHPEIGSPSTIIFSGMQSKIFLARTKLHWRSFPGELASIAKVDRTILVTIHVSVCYVAAMCAGWPQRQEIKYSCHLMLSALQFKWNRMLIKNQAHQNNGSMTLVTASSVRNFIFSVGIHDSPVVDFGFVQEL